MFQGFYNLTSGMLAQYQNLNTISNNMVNVSTPGYKSDTYCSKTFQEELFYKMGNVNKSNQTPIGTISMARVDDETVTNFQEGAPMETGSQLDFKIQGDGFFRIALTGGGYAYTRNGSFYVDQEGYLALKGCGRVQGTYGNIRLDTDDITVDSNGGLYNKSGVKIDNIQVVDFDDYSQMVKESNGTFTTNQNANFVQNPTILNKYLEGSNVDNIREMTNMMATQRSIQSAAQILRMYDQIMGKAVTDIGKA